MKVNGVCGGSRGAAWVDVSVAQGVAAAMSPVVVAG
jgi:hypothetical protein